MGRRLHPEMLSVEDWLVKQGVRDLPVPKVQVLQKGVAAMLQRLMREDNPLIEGQGGEQRLDRRAALGLALSTAWGAGSVLPALLQPRQGIQSPHKRVTPLMAFQKQVSQDASCFMQALALREVRPSQAVVAFSVSSPLEIR